MIYKKNENADFDYDLFLNPTAEYRAAPFWAWNSELDKNELLRQIEALKKMGFGGYHIHSRAGMATEYLGDEFMDLVKACLEKGKAEDMLTYLYDEDRYPSGFAGGIVTKNKAYRLKYLCFTEREPSSNADIEKLLTKYTSYFKPSDYDREFLTDKEPVYKKIAEYDILLNSDGSMHSYKRIGENDECKGKRCFAFLCEKLPMGRFNGFTYVDTLDKEAMDEFIRVTYEKYKAEFGEDFGKAIPDIFTDEPQFSQKKPLESALGEVYAEMPWTTDFDVKFTEKFGYSITDRLPEIFWNTEGGAPSKARYDYHNYVADIFSETFAGNVGKWCEENGLPLTGHMMKEESLTDQNGAVGEVMRSLRYFTIPGIDMLCNKTELTTAKQAQSVARQYGREGVMSELYGVTGWQFDFRGHKFQGDWQAALGVTLRVPHLSWVSMKGAAKRDYPASINYQSAWYEKYSYVEDHFARLNVALTRGKPIVRAALIHPVESVYSVLSANDVSAAELNEMNGRFRSAVKWLVGGLIDFDFISEALLPSQYSATGDNGLKVGEMNYSAVVIPPLDTVRKSTLDILTEFVERGGKVIFTGECPRSVDGELSDGAETLYRLSEKCAFDRTEILSRLKDERDISVYDENGVPVTDFVYTLREDGDAKWLFLARYVQEDPTGVGLCAARKVKITVKGSYKAELFDTVNGKIKDISFTVNGGETVLDYTLYAQDSLLIRLLPAKNGEKRVINEEFSSPDFVIDFKNSVDYKLSEPNVVVLDIGRYSFDKKGWSEPEEMLRIDKKLRKEFSYSPSTGGCQPWAKKNAAPDKFPYIKFEVESNLSVDCSFAYEELTELEVNGVSVPVIQDGYFTDKAIKTMKIPSLKKGKNVIIARVPVSERISIENFFLLGDFGVKTTGAKSEITERAKKLSFDSVTGQGLPFYGAAVTYVLPVDVPDCNLNIKASGYKGAIVSVKIDGKDAGNICYAPYGLFIKDVPAGKREIELTVYLSRVNCFGALHDTYFIRPWKGAAMYETRDEEWSYEYVLQPLGITKSPIIEVYKKP